MSSETGSETPPCDFDDDAVYCARVKWFNNKAGYGFCTVVKADDETKMGTDVFVHHSGIIVGSEQYKYLVQGEYVDFKMRATEGGDHAVQASNVTGVGGGWLMCETRQKARQAAEQNRSEDGDGEERARPARRRPAQRRSGNGEQVRFSGGGPRDGEIWTLTRSTVSKSKHKNHNKDEDSKL